MTFRRPIVKRNVAQRDVANYLEFTGGGTEMQQAVRRKTGTQKETAYDKANAEAARALYGATLYKNRRGMVQLPGGGMFPYGLGPNGFGDRVGYTPMVITPDLVGKKVAVFTMVESKTPEGRVSPDQERCIQEVRDAGGIAGVSRSADDIVMIYRGWHERR